MKQEMGIQVSSKIQEWITPPEIINSIKEVLGYIDLDPASSVIANKIINANKIFTEEDDSLTKEWKCDTCFMNPPYGKIGTKSQAGIFAEYFINQYIIGNINKEGIILVHSRFGYTWFNDLIYKLTSCTLKDRIRFINPNTMKQGDMAKTSQTLFYIGENNQKFIEVFKDKGLIYNK